MKDIDVTRNSELRTREDADRHDSLMLKVVFWIIAIAVGGTLLCIILGALRYAIQTVLIIGGILLLIALAFAVFYERIKYRIRFRREQDDKGDD